MRQRGSAWRSAWCWMLALAGAARGAEPVRIVHADDLLRPESIFRCRIAGDVAADAAQDGPFRVQAVLDRAGTVIASNDALLPRRGLLRDGLTLVLLPGADVDDGRPVTLRVTLTNAARTVVERVERPLVTPREIAVALERATADLRQRGDTAPLPWLWAEQGAELMAAMSSAAPRASGATGMGRPIVAAREVRRLTAAIAARSAAASPAPRWEVLPSAPDRDGRMIAFRDDVDGSVQPVRVTAAAGAIDGPAGSLPIVMVCAGAGDVALGKSRWPQPADPAAAALIGDARRGAAVVEVYAAGDRSWTGVAADRIDRALAAAVAVFPSLDARRVALVGIGAGAAGAVRQVEERPGAWRLLVLIDPRLPDGDDPRTPGRRPAHLTAQPVLVVRDGTGEVDAATGRMLAALSALGHEAVIAGEPRLPAGWAAQAPRALGELVFIQPRILAGFAVTGLSRWGEPGTLRLGGDGSETIGIAQVLPWPAASGSGAMPLVRRGRLRKTLGQAMGPLDAYRDRPFAVVVGTGEHLAAQDDDRDLADRFVAAWAMHAHGLPSRIDDSAWRDEAFPRHHLVCIGSPRSNRVLGSLARRLAERGQPLPVAWDSRSLSAGGRTVLRGDRRAVALCWPHPAGDGRMIVVLDGAPAWPLARGWRDGALPLGGLPDLVIGGRPGEAPAVWTTFGNDWDAP